MQLLQFKENNLYHFGRIIIHLTWLKHVPLNFLCWNPSIQHYSEVGLSGYDETLRASLSEMGLLHFKVYLRELSGGTVRSQESGEGLHQASTLPVSWSWISLLSHCEKNISVVFEEAHPKEFHCGSAKILTSPQEKQIQISRSRIFISITCY